MAIFDTGAAFIHIPPSIHEILLAMWKDDLKMSDDEFFQGKSGLWEVKT